MLSTFYTFQNSWMFSYFDCLIPWLHTWVTSKKIIYLLSILFDGSRFDDLKQKFSSVLKGICSDFFTCYFLLNIEAYHTNCLDSPKFERNGPSCFLFIRTGKMCTTLEKSGIYDGNYRVCVQLYPTEDCVNFGCG